MKPGFKRPLAAVWLRFISAVIPGGASPSLSGRDDDFRPGVPLFYISDGIGGFKQLVAFVDHRSYLSGLDKSAEGRQVVSLRFSQ